MNASPTTSHTLHKILQNAVTRLAGAGIENPRLEASVLLSHVLNVGRETFLLDPDREVAEPQAAKFQEWVERRLRKEPVAYLTGQREFWSLEFAVDPHVLIPRPETEGIIEQLIRIAGAEGRGKALSVLDVGTGSGILAVTAAVEFPQARVTAVDVSPEALAVAEENARRHGVAERIEFLQRDMMTGEGLPGSGGFDFILSNPPYIPSGDLPHLMPDVRDYEPIAALDGGPDGLAFYRKLVPLAGEGLKPGGSLILEVGDGQAGAVEELIKSHVEFEHIAIHHDLSGTGRVVSARRALG